VFVNRPFLFVLLLSSMGLWPAAAQEESAAARFPRAGTIELSLGFAASYGLAPYAGEPPYRTYETSAICVENADRCLLSPPVARPVPRMKQGFFGGRVGVWLSRRSAIDGSFWYSGPFTEGMNDLVCGLRYVYNLTPGQPRYTYLLIGPTIVTRHAEYVSATKPGAELGVGMRFASLLWGELRDYWYQTTKQQHDLLLSIGISFLIAEPE
jgi:hypothetical protein